MKRLACLALILFAHSALAAIIPAKIHTAKGDITLAVETATTPDTRAYGLMNRPTLKPNDGMLFKFPRTGQIAFWMKDTLIPLDMLFISPDGKIVHINTNATPLSTTPIDSQKPVNTVIEIDGGRAQKEGIALGNKVEFTLPAGTHVE